MRPISHKKKKDTLDTLVKRKKTYSQALKLLAVLLQGWINYSCAGSLLLKHCIDVANNNESDWYVSQTNDSNITEDKW